jgi:signal transduction histidine kinase
LFEGTWFSRSVLLIQEEERARLSRELHDTIAQDLRYLSLRMENISKTNEATEREKLCTDAVNFQSVMIKKIRDICNDLVPLDFRFQGLAVALRQYCLDFCKRTGIDCRIDITENINLEFLSEEKQLQIFRIVQEALVNVEKHAEATEAIVILHCTSEGNLSVGISDDGKGLDPAGINTVYQSPKNKMCFGIRGMNERAVLLGGSLEIKSEPKEGTLVRFRLSKE